MQNYHHSLHLIAVRNFTFQTDQTALACHYITMTKKYIYIVLLCMKILIKNR